VTYSFTVIIALYCFNSGVTIQLSLWVERKARTLPHRGQSNKGLHSLLKQIDFDYISDFMYILLHTVL